MSAYLFTEAKTSNRKIANIKTKKDMEKKKTLKKIKMYFSRHYLLCLCYIVKWQIWISNRKEHYPHLMTQNNTFSTKDN